MRMQPGFKKIFFFFFFWSLTLFYDLKKLAHLDKNNLICRKYVQNKGNVVNYFFLHFTDISS